MDILVNRFTVSFNYPVYFTENIFNTESQVLKTIFSSVASESVRKILFVLDKGVLDAYPGLLKDIPSYFKHNPSGVLCCEEIVVVPGGEEVKNRPEYLQQVMDAVERNGICRHSFLIAIGGGAVLDMAGFAASMSHRGVKHIRIPTTVLSQNDSGIGVKNGINAFGKKNFIGSFAPPYAVINDYAFLKTLSARDWRSGISEAIKVALIKDAAFYNYIENNTDNFNSRDEEAIKYLVKRCAQLHMEHIASGDPFESGSSRPLDFGHWAAHKLEQLSSYRIRHGEAVATGIALDVTISFLKGMISESDWKKIVSLILNLGFDTYVPEFAQVNEKGVPLVVNGLNEFREHLGGRLTIMLLEKIGKGKEVHELDPELVVKSIAILKQLQDERVNAFTKAN